MVFLETSFSFLLLMGQIIFSKMTMWYLCAYRHTHISRLTQYAFLHGIDMPPSRGVGLCFLSLNLCRHEGSSECWVLSQHHGLGAQPNDQESMHLAGKGRVIFIFYFEMESLLEVAPEKVSSIQSPLDSTWRLTGTFLKIYCRNHSWSKRNNL